MMGQWCLFCRSNLPVAIRSGPGGPSYRIGSLIEKISPFGGRLWNERKDTNAPLYLSVAAKGLHVAVCVTTERRSWLFLCYE